MNCSNCFNGCSTIISDKCVRYTGIPVPVLGIQTGDSLSYVEQALITFLTSTLDGTGIKLTIDESIICDTVSQYIPDCEDLSALNLFKALIQASCDLQEQIDVINTTLDTLNADYTIGCLTGVTASSDTHAIVQAVITKLCAVDTSLTALAANVTTNYVRLADLDTLIQEYLDSVSPVSQYNSRMVPYTVIPYFGSLANFDGSGKGISANGFDKIYLCNGSNGTPDIRGRSLIGAIQGVPGGGALSPVVDPSYPGNTNYALSTTNGVNTITLSTLQIPSHTHTATVVITDPGHRHDILGITGGDTDDNNNTVRFAGGDKNQGETSFYFTNTQACQTSVTGLSIAVTNASQGGGQSHPNVHPVIGSYFIMYIP